MPVTTGTGKAAPGRACDRRHRGRNYGSPANSLCAPHEGKSTESKPSMANAVRDYDGCESIVMTETQISSYHARLRDRFFDGGDALS
jgi:hypothetical protein